MEIDKLITREEAIEDRKDKRVRLEGQQQSQMISQRQQDGLPINFASDAAAADANVEQLSQDNQEMMSNEQQQIS